MEAAGQLMTLKEENDSLKCQLEAYINEAEMVKLESKQTVDALEKQIKSLQNALKGMQQVRGARFALCVGDNNSRGKVARVLMLSSPV